MWQYKLSCGAWTPEWWSFRRGILPWATLWSKYDFLELNKCALFVMWAWLLTMEFSGAVLCYTLQTVLSVRPSALRFRSLSSFWSIFFKLCMNIDIREEWFGIAHGLYSFINNRVMALDWCKNVFFLNIFRTNGWILIKFCMCIDIYKIHIVSNAHYFWSIFNRVMALDQHQNFVYAQYLVN